MLTIGGKTQDKHKLRLKVVQSIKEFDCYVKSIDIDNQIVEPWLLDLSMRLNSEKDKYINRNKSNNINCVLNMNKCLAEFKDAKSEYCVDFLFKYIITRRLDALVISVSESIEINCVNEDCKKWIKENIAEHVKYKFLKDRLNVTGLSDSIDIEDTWSFFLKELNWYRRSSKSPDAMSEFINKLPMEKDNVIKCLRKEISDYVQLYNSYYFNIKTGIVKIS